MTKRTGYQSNPTPEGEDRMSNRMFRLALVVATVLAAGCSPEYPNCSNDGECHENEFCVNGSCQQCRDDSDCPRGQQCNSGRCDPIPGWCESDADCPADEHCVDNRCVPRPVEEEPIAATPQACTLQSVYFAYDESDITSSSGNTLQSNAECINERDIPHVTITGHCDPRGTEEYNLALGHRRAQAVQSYMRNLGVPNNRMTTQSMGEEMARGSSESTWSQDRRAEFEER